jgi:hypothetical protein
MIGVTPSLLNQYVTVLLLEIGIKPQTGVKQGKVPIMMMMMFSGTTRYLEILRTWKRESSMLQPTPRAT